MQIIADCRTAIKSPPSSAVAQRILYSRLRAYWSRCEYVLWNLIGIGLLYMFSDSLLNQYINDKKYYMNIIFHSFQLIATIAYFITSLKNPGYVTLNTNIKSKNEIENNNNNNNEQIEEQQLMLNMEANNNEYKSENNNDNNNNICKYIQVNDQSNDKHKRFSVVHEIPYYNRTIIIDNEFESSWPSNYCEQCNFIRPIRSKHCFFCGKCIQKFDHHCPLVGNCIAANNYRYFLIFLIFESMVVLWSFYMSINTLFVISIHDVHMKQNHNDILYKHTIIGWIFRIIFFVVMFMFLFSIIGLTGFHFYLLSTNQTTMELMRPDSIDKYLHEETKKKKKFDRKYRKNNQNKKPQINVNSNYDINDSGDYQYRFYGNITSYRTYFDEGCLKNVQMVLKGTVKSEWKTPLKCKFRINDRNNR